MDGDDIDNTYDWHDEEEPSSRIGTAPNVEAQPKAAVPAPKGLYPDNSDTDTSSGADDVAPKKSSGGSPGVGALGGDMRDGK